MPDKVSRVEFELAIEVEARDFLGVVFRPVCDQPHSSGVSRPLHLTLRKVQREAENVHDPNNRPRISRTLFRCHDLDEILVETPRCWPWPDQALCLTSTLIIYEVSLR